ncbi:MAG TPA: hypothetical protein VGN00_14330 [Puia sp.]|jgi:alpha-tubulin suppressor-like RCC1 family protein
MRKLLFILLFFPALAHAQWTGSGGEYVPLLLNTATHRAYTLNNGVPTIVTSPTNVSQVIGGPHSAALIDNLGNVWAKGQNGNGVVPCGSTADQANFVMCMTDNLGATLDPVVQVFLGGNGNHGLFWNIFAVTSTGKLYGAGEMEGYVQGDGTAGDAINTRWVRIDVGGELVTKIQGGYGMLAMTSLGHTYTWGADKDPYVNGQGNSVGNGPVQISLGAGRTAIDIASNGLVHVIVLDNGDELATSQQFLNDYTGLYPTATTKNFQNVTAFLNLPAHPKAVSMNSSTTYAILTTGALWAWGDNSCGTIGNGDMLDWGAYKCCPGPSSGSPARYAYDNGNHEHMVIHPVEVIPGKLDWMKVIGSPSNSWFAYANDSLGRFYTWGRNKFGPLVNGIIGANPINGAIGAAYPDSYEDPNVTERFPGSITSYTESTSQYCILNPSGTPCNTYSIPTNTKPTSVFTATYIGNGKVVLDNSASTDNVRIVYRIFSQTAGTSLLLRVRTGETDTLTGATPGVYTFKSVIRDNGWLSDSSTATVTVSDGTPPTVTPGGPYTITLPTNSQVITVTATGNGGATITGYAWTKTSGPGATTITGNTTRTPTVSGLQQGAYVFNCVVTDSNGSTTGADVSVTVNPASCTNCVTLPIRVKLN